MKVYNSNNENKKIIKIYLKGKKKMWALLNVLNNKMEKNYL